MRQNEAHFLALLKIHEGGKYTDGKHPYDPGGPTKWGITIPDIPGATADTIRNLTWEEAVPIYDTKYWDVVCGDDLPSGVDYTVADYGVHSGTHRAIKVLQRVVGVREDGVMGPETLAAVKARDPKAVINAICDERLHFLRSLRIWEQDKNGFTARVAEVRASSLDMADQPEKYSVPPVPQMAEPSLEISKGVLPRPVLPTRVVKWSPLAIGAAMWDWAMHHPTAAVVGAVLVVAAAAALVWYLKHRHVVKSTTPMPQAQTVLPATS